MNFFCFSFALNQKYRAANLLRLIAAKSVPKYALSKTGSKITIATQTSKNCRSEWKINFQILHIKLDGALEMILKLLFLQNPTLLKAFTVMNQTLEGYILRFWKNVFRPKYIDLVRSVQICKVFRYVATSVKHFSIAVGCHG